MDKMMMSELQKAPLNVFVVISNCGGQVNVELTDNLSKHVEENYLTQLNLQQVERSYVLKSNEAVTVPLKWVRIWQDFLNNQATHFQGEYHYVRN